MAVYYAPHQLKKFDKPEPLLLQYEGDHANAAEPIFEAVQWRFPIQ